MPTFMGNLAKNYLVCCLLTHTPALLKLRGRLPSAKVPEKTTLCKKYHSAPIKIDLKKKNPSSQLFFPIQFTDLFTHVDNYFLL